MVLSPGLKSSQNTKSLTSERIGNKHSATSSWQLTTEVAGDGKSPQAEFRVKWPVE